jgi:DNA-binding MarR family transcriptional regulator
VTAGDPEALLEEISELYGLVLRIARRVPSDDEPMTATQRLALIEICGAGPMRLRTLARCMETTSATATRAVDALEADGLVERRRDPVDGRGVLVQPTRRGHRWANRRRDALHDIVGQVPPAAMPARLIKDLVRLNHELRVLTGHEELPPGALRNPAPRGHRH